MPAKKSYDWTRFTLHVYLKVSVSRAFAAWTDDQQIIKWFPVKAAIEPKKGGTISLKWLAGDTLDREITQFNLNRKLAFPFGDGGEVVTVTFRKVAGGTICSLCQSGMKKSPKGRVMHTGCMQGWTFFLTNLKSYLEQGIDLRSHDPKRSYRQNYVNS